MTTDYHSVISSRTLRLPMILDANKQTEIFLSDFDELMRENTVTVQLSSNSSIEINNFPIIISINSYGGNVDVMVEIYQQFKRARELSIPIITINTVNAFSAAFSLLIRGNIGVRLAVEESYALAHPVSTATEGTIHNIASYISIVKEKEQRLIEEYIEYIKPLKLKKAQINKIKTILSAQNDSFLSATELLENRFVDKVIKSSDYFLTLSTIVKYLVDRGVENEYESYVANFGLTERL